MNYFKELEELQVREQNYISSYSDYTYEVFERVIKNSIPLAIEHYLRTEPNTFGKVYIKFLFRNVYKDDTIRAKIGFLEDLSSSLKYGNVNVGEFESYMRKIPGVMREDNGNIRLYSFNIRELIEFYYEELQRIEYQTGTSR